MKTFTKDELNKGVVMKKLKEDDFIEEILKLHFQVFARKLRFVFVVSLGVAVIVMLAYLVWRA